MCCMNRKIKTRITVIKHLYSNKINRSETWWNTGQRSCSVCVVVCCVYRWTSVCLGFFYACCLYENVLGTKKHFSIKITKQNIFTVFIFHLKKIGNKKTTTSKGAKWKTTEQVVHILNRSSVVTETFSPNSAWSIK